MAMNGANEIKAKEECEFSDIDLDERSSLLADRILSSIPPKPLALCSIYRVPDNLKKGYEDKYEPNVVSIGPYHRDKPNLKITEKHKLWYLFDFISRSTPSQTSLKDMVKVVKNMEEKARACYAEEIHLSSDDFVKMMVIDGCFILELFYRNGEFRREEDLVYITPWLIETVKQDLVLLENQLPFIILVCLYQLNTHPIMSLNNMVLDFFGMGNFLILSNMVQGSNHLLDFLRNCMIPREFNPTAYPMSSIHFFHFDELPCAKKLQKMGVKFKVSIDPLAFLNVTFEEGYLKFNCLRNGITHFLFPNWIAMEQCNYRFKGYITSYTLLLGQLANSRDDVKFLRETGVIIVGSEVEDEEFVTEISRLCQRLKPIEFHYADLFLALKFYRSIQRLEVIHRLLVVVYNNWNVILKCDYFSSPWAVISFIAAIVVLVLSIYANPFRLS